VVRLERSKIQRTKAVQKIKTKPRDRQHTPEPRLEEWNGRRHTNGDNRIGIEKEDFGCDSFR
jgi:hypothetical protein